MSGKVMKDITEVPTPHSVIVAICPDCNDVHIICVDDDENDILTFVITDEILNDIIEAKKRGSFSSPGAEKGVH